MIRTGGAAGLGLTIVLSLVACSGSKKASGTGGSGGAGSDGRGGSSGSAGSAGTAGNVGSGGAGATGTAGAGAGAGGGMTGTVGSGGAGTTGSAGAGAGGSAGTTGTAGVGSGGAGTTGSAGSVGSGGAGTTGSAGAGAGGGAGTTGSAGAGAGGTAGCRASVSGVVYDPAGKLPIYNAIVYAPTTPLDPLPTTVSCDRCGARPSGNPAATTLSDSAGHFRLDGVPAGSNVPLVIQIGKWRRQVTIPTVAACADTALTDVELTRLPRTKAEGNIPRIAVTTGGADALECLLRRVGIADSEFTADTGAGRVHLYAGGDGTSSLVAGDALTPAAMLWASPTKLASYDMLVLSCEGSTSKFSAMKPQTSVDNVAAYVGTGGRLLASHLHSWWLSKSPAFSGTAAYAGPLAAPPAGVSLTVNQNFPKGVALAAWLAGPSVNASSTLGQLVTNGSEHSVTSVTPPTTEWLYLVSNPSNNMRSEQYLTFNAPVADPPALQCGRVGFTDMHVKVTAGAGGGDDSDPSKPFPSGCRTNDMSAQQKAVEFLLFDLGGCIQPDSVGPAPP